MISMAQKVKGYFQRQFTRDELKILTYKKVKSGLSYPEAVAEVKKEISKCKEVHKNEVKKSKKSKNQEFKEDFDRITHEKKK